jgi:hypothetical protein
MNTRVLYNDLFGIFMLKAKLKKDGFAGLSISPNFNFHCSVIIAYIIDVNSHGSRQSGALCLSVFTLCFPLNDETWGRETEYKVSYFLECI